MLWCYATYFKLFIKDFFLEEKRGIHLIGVLFVLSPKKEKPIWLYPENLMTGFLTFLQCLFFYFYLCYIYRVFFFRVIRFYSFVSYWCVSIYLFTCFFSVGLQFNVTVSDVDIQFKYIIPTSDVKKKIWSLVSGKSPLLLHGPTYHELAGPCQ